MTNRSLSILTTLALLGAFALAALPAVHAGSLANPEIVDDNDEVAITGAGPLGCSGGPSATPPCPGFDFFWPDADINSGFVNETATALTFTLEMKAGTSFGAGYAGVFVGPHAGKDTCTYVFSFTVGGVSYTASADVTQDGTPTVGGAATAVTIHDGNQMTWEVPKAAVGAHAGSVVSGLFVTSHCKTDTGVLEDDRAPDANTGRDYTVGGAGASTTVYHTIGNKTVAIAQAFATATTGVTQYNWTQGPAAGSFAIKLTPAGGNGTLALVFKDAKGAEVYNKTFSAATATAQAFSGKAAGAWTLSVAATGFKGNLTLAIAPQAAPATNSGSASGSASVTATGGVTSTSKATSSSTSTSGKGTPAPLVPLALVALGAVVLLRRRLQ
jgi:MYXO-CTERM domain-containing protein